jgi:hypothetical protein
MVLDGVLIGDRVVRELAGVVESPRLRSIR